MTLDEYKKSHGLTDAMIAAAIKVTATSVIRYRLGLRIPRPSVMRAIINATDGKVTASDFYNAHFLSDKTQ